MFGLLENVLLDKSQARDVLSGKQIVEEENLIIDGLQLSKKSYYEYNQFLKNTSNFSAFFSEDGLKQLKASLKAFKVKNICTVCSVVFNQKYIVKICSICYSIIHYSFTNLTKNTNKKWLCSKCID